MNPRSFVTHFLVKNKVYLQIIFYKSTQPCFLNTTLSNSYDKYLPLGNVFKAS